MTASKESSLGEVGEVGEVGEIGETGEESENVALGMIVLGDADSDAALARVLVTMASFRPLP